MRDTDVVVQGVGTSGFGKQPERTAIDLGIDAILEAMDDAGVDEVDAVYIGTVYEPFGSGQRILELRDGKLVFKAKPALARRSARTPRPMAARRRRRRPTPCSPSARSTSGSPTSWFR